MRKSVFAALVFLALPAARADDEASNTPHVVVSQYGRCYAKSVPAESYGDKGATKVYTVQQGYDALVQTFSWFSNRIFLECNVSKPDGTVGIAVVRFGPWARGQQASNNDLAIAFYFAGRLVRQYSTLELAGSPGNVSQSISHYTVIEHVDGFREQLNNLYRFEVLATDGRRLVFDPTSGRMLPAEKKAK